MLLRVLALEVGTLEVWVVAVDADPGERVDDPLGPLRPISLGIGVFDSKDERATEPTSERPVEQRGTGATDVEIAGG